ncbi:MAG: UvrD-helicase domain-containing protein [Planctomycetota bacterium]|nr:UvrD-helicase domain-containing protein [Planctomycetota bacterium]
MDWMDAQAAETAAQAVGWSADDLLGGLNKPQAEAVTHPEGPLLILAGPGSGKTRVITSRIAWLVTQQGVRPDEILAITFTNKAAAEMRERVHRLLPELSGAWISTFHSMCARILRRDIEHLAPYTRDFSIHDTTERNALIKQVVKDLGYDPKRFRPAVLGGWISNEKNRAADPGETLVVDDGSGMEDEVFSKVKAAYAERLAAQNALDFDDLLLKTLELFDKHPGVRDSYARRFRYVLVDEYQDTNRVQYLLTAHLASGHGNLTVCGDPDQSIYGWRGADIRNILDFEEDFGSPLVVRLEQNYRSTKTILAAASAVIANNTRRKAKDLWTDGDQGERLVCLECGDENEEAREIAAQVRGLQARGSAWGQCAIFYRVNFMQRALESALRLSGVPYQVVGGLEFYARREIRDLVAYLRLLVNPRDDQAFARVVNAPLRGVGQTTLERLLQWSLDRRVPLREALRSQEAIGLVRGRAKKGLAEFAGILEELEAFKDGPAGPALDAVLESIGRERWLAEMDDGEQSDVRDANVEELRAHAHEYDRLNPAGKLPGFLQDVALVSDTDAYDGAEDAVKLMTLHSAKGLEFDHVFIAGCEEEILPHARAVEEDPELGVEEERRLFYVGLTRARKTLTLTRAVTRLFFGDTRWARASSFLDELPPELVEGMESDTEEEALGAYEPEPASGPSYAVGQRVHHEHFGRGRIERLTGSGVNARADVRFDVHGNKQLLLTYANLQVVS